MVMMWHKRVHIILNGSRVNGDWIYIVHWLFADQCRFVMAYDLLDRRCFLAFLFKRKRNVFDVLLNR